jgi:hypothetical protein
MREIFPTLRFPITVFGSLNIAGLFRLAQSLLIGVFCQPPETPIVERGISDMEDKSKASWGPESAAVVAGRWKHRPFVAHAARQCQD